MGAIRLTKRDDERLKRALRYIPVHRVQAAKEVNVRLLRVRTSYRLGFIALSTDTKTRTMQDPRGIAKHITKPKKFTPVVERHVHLATFQGDVSLASVEKWADRRGLTFADPWTFFASLSTTKLERICRTVITSAWCEGLDSQIMLSAEYVARRFAVHVDEALVYTARTVWVPIHTARNAPRRAVKKFEPRQRMFPEGTYFLLQEK